MPLTDPSSVRLYCGIPAEGNPDNEIQSFINRAQEVFIGDIAIRVFDEEHPADNVKINVSDVPLADVTFDNIVNRSDVSVYVWKDKADATTKSKIAYLTAVEPRTGLIVLNSTPSDLGGVDRLTVDYSYYNYPIRDDLVTLAVSYLAGYLYVTAQTMLIPESYALGPLRYTKFHPVIKLERNYKRVLNMLRVKIWEKVPGVSVLDIHRSIEGGNDVIVSGGVNVPLD